MTTFRHRQARTLLFAAACASIVACQSADIANFNSPNTSQLEGSPNAATVNTTVAGVLAGSRSGAGTWASTLGIFGREIMNLDGAEPREFAKARACRHLLCAGEVSRGGRVTLG